MEELAAAKSALSKGYKDQFMFGLERCGAVQSSVLVKKKDIYGISDSITKAKNTRPDKEAGTLCNIRVLQRKGKIIVAEDFTSL